MALEKERGNKNRKGREKEFGVQKKIEREREGIEVSVKDLKRVEKVDREDLCTEKTVSEKE